MNKKPDFLIIGAMKCATSTLHEQLAMQPGIFMTELKEPNFFSDDEQYDQGMEWYLSHFHSANNTDICGESSTHYTKLPTYPHTVERIYQHFPDIKLIYIMRHPIDRLVSQYIHEWSQGIISVDINEAIDKYPELIEYSRYSMQLEPYLKTFKTEQILLVSFERLLSHQQQELERICKFIGYNNRPNWTKDRGAKNISSERMRKNALRDFVINLPILKQIRQNFIPKTWRNWVRSLWQMKQKPEIEPSNIKKLKSIFDEDLSIVNSWLDTKLSCDKFKSIVKSKNFDFKFKLNNTNHL